MKSADAIRVAVVGSGPAGLYAIQHLLEQDTVAVEIDLFERLPTPWGQVRAAVAPDHPQKKLIIERQFSRLLANPLVRFYGNVEVGSDLRHAELVDWYDAVIYAVGANSETRMGIPGEELPGCWGAREFVGWYSGHPDFSDLQFDFSCERAVVVGNGNVALDVARILMQPIAALEKTDIAEYALHALRHSRIREVVILGRRGHFQGAFSNPELEELEHLPDVDIVVDSEDLPSDDPQHYEVVLDGADWSARRKVKTLQRLAAKHAGDAGKTIVLRFLTSPVEVLGGDRVEQLLVVRNHLEHDQQGHLRARPTEEESLLDTGLVLRAIGCRGYPFPGLPFDERLGVIDNDAGRVVGQAGVYVAGWIKRGAQGMIGSNRKCARQTVDCLLADWARGALAMAKLSARDVEACLDDRTIDWVSYSDWLHIDRLEREAGVADGRSRVKMCNRYDLLHCLTGLNDR